MLVRKALELWLEPLKLIPMPIYEFHCAKCRKDSEVLVRSTHWKGTPCPHCGSTKLAKKLSVFASAVAESGGGGGACCPDASACQMRSTGACCGGGPHRH